MSHVITFYNRENDYVLVSMINQGFSPLVHETSDKKSEYFLRFQGVFRCYNFGSGDWVDPLECPDLVDMSIGAPNPETDWVGVKDWLNEVDKGAEPLYILPLLPPVNCRPTALEGRDEMDVAGDLLRDRFTAKIDDKNKDQFFYQERVQDGVFYAEIRKPLSDRPYTIVVRDWSEDKLIYMFSSICACPSFGVFYPHDRNFILSLWKWKKMKEPFNLDSLANFHIDAVKAGRAEEPIVYRLAIQDVMDDQKEWKSGSKRRLEYV